MNIRGFVTDRLSKGALKKGAPSIKLGRGKSTPKTKKPAEFNCTTCPLNGSQPIVDDSVDFSQVDVVFVGGACTLSDASHMALFSGKSGEVLRQAVEHVGFKNVYYTTCVKCGMNVNMEPSPVTIKSCRYLLEHELEETANSRKLIITMGSVALAWFTKYANVEEHRGKFFDTNWGKVMATFDPLYVSKYLERQDALGVETIELFVNELQRAKDYIDTGHIYKNLSHLFKVVRTMDDIKLMEEELMSASEVGLDYEASGLDVFVENFEVYSIALSKDAEYVWNVPYKFLPQHIRDAATEVVKHVVQEKNIIVHNAEYDILVAHVAQGMPLKPVYDTNFMFYLLNANRGQGISKLKRLVLDYLDFGDYGVDHELIKDLPLEELVRYNCTDALALPLLARKMYNQFQKENQLLWESYNNEFRGSQALLIEATAAGMTINVMYALKEQKRLLKKIRQLKETANQGVGKEINMGSPKQVIEYLQSQGLHVTGTGKDILVPYQKQYPFIKTLLDYRASVKLEGTYITPYIMEHTRKDNLVHSRYSLGIAATGRVSSSNPNLQNIPTRIGPVIENMFMSRWGDAGKIIKADYAQTELRIAGIVSGDKKMREFFLAGKDIHSMVAMEQYGISEADIVNGTSAAKEGRRAAKGFNFGVIYGRGVYSLAQELGISLEDAEERRRGYFDLFFGLAEWLELTRFFASKHGYVESMFGQRRYIPQVWSKVLKIKEEGSREAVNTPIQGAASHACLIGLRQAVQEMHRRRLRVVWCNFVHDAGLFDSPDEEVDEVIEIIKDKAVKIQLPIETDVPFAIDIKVGRTWGDCA